ncbi:MarR family winged helix-turn-helix transcriptional regulator [Photobacterium alginatilyticum]|uniref:MarR family transcriptional regulator n=1 Tax=Photobacterium alginatilyticum TaxID=1775171 RepID=A0ABW9YME2_9GAMM|nr:MarR family transcriptional regulator [Photobacterium alginatilyticum]NBI54229.1 MarR family transcriptional regulator [Photobacterium alginatilyticum]
MSKQETVANILKKIEDNWPQSAEKCSPAILRLHRIHDYHQQDLIGILDQYDLQRADFSVLAALRRQGEPCCLSPTELYRSMLFSSGGLTKVLSRITTLGLIERLDNPEDKRSKLVKLTEKGKELIDRIIHQLHNHEQEFVSVLSEKEQEQLNSLLEKLLTGRE